MPRDCTAPLRIDLMDSPTPLGGTPYTMKQPQRQRRRSSLKGRGDYSEEVKSILKPLPRLEAKLDHLERALVHSTPKISSAANTIGRTLGNFVNQGDLGALAGESLAKFFGHGDYKVKHNSLIKGPLSGPNPPKFGKSGRRGTRVMEREFIGDVFSGSIVSGSSVFTNTSLRINPTDRATFPWLSTIANQYDQWEPNGIVFEFVSTSSSYNGTSQALGTVIMATDYDVFDTKYPSKQIMENADYSCSTRPAESLVHGIECDPKERPTPILYTSTQAGSNLQDLGNFQIATTGCSTAGARLGELWISYDITFYKKQLVSPTVSLNLISCSGSSTAAGNPLLQNPVISVQKGIFLTPLVGTGTRVVLPPSQGSGRYRFTYLMSIRSAGDTFSPSYTNCAVVSSREAGVIGNAWLWDFVVELLGPEASFIIGLKINAAGTNYNFSVVEVPDDFIN